MTKRTGLLRSVTTWLSWLLLGLSPLVYTKTSVNDSGDKSRNYLGVSSLILKFLDQSRLVETLSVGCAVIT
ncbi:hypothetical protein, partial [Cronobacter sakazakii]|uniref:hypothetical protein n=1 Tax=Cronobacter sakazakii TaxID=28141 RepID=UPI0030FE7F1B